MDVVRISIVCSLAVLCGSCASTYQAINPKTMSYGNTTLRDSIEFSYRYDVLNYRGNRKYAKKEVPQGVKVVAVKVVNNGPNSFLCGDDYVIFSNGKKMRLLAPSEAFKKLRQIAPGYLLYMLLTPMQFYSGNTTLPIGLVLGPVITLGNFTAAITANDKFKTELETMYIYGRVIEPGEEVYGVICIDTNGYGPLSME